MEYYKDRKKLAVAKSSGCVEGFGLKEAWQKFSSNGNVLCLEGG